MVQVSVQICQEERTIFVTYAGAEYKATNLPDCSLETLWGSMYRYVLNQMAKGEQNEIDFYYGRDNERVVFEKFNKPNTQTVRVCF